MQAAYKAIIDAGTMKLMTREIANDLKRRRRYVQSQGLGKVTVSWSIVFVLPADRRRYILLVASPRREKERRVPRALQRRLRDGYRIALESRTTCNLGINSYLSLSLSLFSFLFFSSLLSLSLFLLSVFWRWNCRSNSSARRQGRGSKAKFRSSTTTSVPRANFTL